MNHEIFVTPEAVKLLGTQRLLVEQQAAEIANDICDLKDFKRGLSCMVVVRESGHSKGKPSTWFVINQVLDTQRSADSSNDLNKNTRSLNRDAHCIMSIHGNGPNRYASFKPLLSASRAGELKRRIK